MVMVMATVIHQRPVMVSRMHASNEAGPERLDVLFEDNHLLVVNKAAGVVTQGAAAGVASLVERAKLYLKQRYQKPGNVYLGVVSRLDAQSTGVLVLARTSKAAGRLSRQFRERTVEKRYWILVHPAARPANGHLEDWLRKDEATHRMVTCQASHPEGQRALLEYHLLGERPHQHLEVRLDTGRKHQIRVQFASRGWPVVGDRKYGSRVSFPQGIALHARQLTLRHPVTRESMTFTAELPAAWPSEISGR